MKKTDHINIRVTPKEHGELKKKAKQKDMTVSRYMLEACLRGFAGGMAWS